MAAHCLSWLLHTSLLPPPFAGNSLVLFPPRAKSPSGEQSSQSLLATCHLTSEQHQQDACQSGDAATAEPQVHPAQQNRAADASTQQQAPCAQSRERFGGGEDGSMLEVTCSNVAELLQLADHWDVSERKHKHITHTHAHPFTHTPTYIHQHTH
jgi:hypothetical protein